VNPREREEDREEEREKKREERKKDTDGKHRRNGEEKIF